TENDFKDAAGKGKVSRYAWGRDYHYVVWEKLDELIEYIKILDPCIKCKSYIDTGPVMDKAWAVRAGLGWLGKHSNVINPKMGSWFFIANIFTNKKFPFYNEQIPDYCGSCTACIDACPTDAIIEDYVVDSNKCISYLTIENKGEIPDQFLDKFDNWIFGCDICQDVCPWNIKFTKHTDIIDFQSTENMTLDLNEIEQMTNKSFNLRFKESPILRARVKGLKRNAEFIKRGLNP
ncbi:MAG: tRNA epoxyqueuosine(34) reductase QueG, partial [Melioribacteraceae bacterium]|nr:tRNA epoxyqueuosine(34) reductase QueG [Melioribacteraceae bacterium]